MNTFIQQGRIKLIKSDSKTLVIIKYNYKTILFQINAVFWTFYSFYKESWKKCK